MIVLILIGLFFTIVLPSIFIGAFIGAFVSGWLAMGRALERDKQPPYLRRVLR